uniref:F-box domain-containing protein n=1 Tax=Tetradesmus obliquus TaxID=3088 RepID=A0A383VHV6_TETOB|eukprot:jgi/Sobl393_1/14057/SZX64254.1
MVDQASQSAPAAKAAAAAADSPSESVWPIILRHITFDINQRTACSLLASCKALRSAFHSYCAGTVPISVELTPDAVSSSFAPWLSIHGTLVKELDVTLHHWTHNPQADEQSWAPQSPKIRPEVAAAAAAASGTPGNLPPMPWVAAAAGGVPGEAAAAPGPQLTLFSQGGAVVADLPLLLQSLGAATPAALPALLQGANAATVNAAAAAAAAAGVFVDANAAAAAGGGDADADANIDANTAVELEEDADAFENDEAAAAEEDEFEDGGSEDEGDGSGSISGSESEDDDHLRPPYCPRESAAEAAVAAALQQASLSAAAAAAANPNSSSSSSSGLMLSSFSSTVCYSSIGAVLQQLPVAQLTSLSLKWDNEKSADTPGGPAALAQLTNLRKLTLYSYKQKRYLAAVTQLRQLSFLRFMPHSSKNIQVLSELRSLQRLHLCLSHYDSSRCLQMGALTSVTELEASVNMELDEGDVLPPNVRRLTVFNILSVEPLRALTQLQSLFVDDCRFGWETADTARVNSGLAQLATTHRQLTSVQLQYSEASLHDEDGVVAALAALPLTHLKLEGTSRDFYIGADVAGRLSQLTALTSLELCGPRVFCTPKAFIAALGCLTRLERLALGELSFKCDQERRARTVKNVALWPSMEAIDRIKWAKRDAARAAADAGELSAEAADAAVAAADAEAAAAVAAAEADGDAAAAKLSDEQVNEIYERDSLWELEKQLFNDEREGIFAAAAALPQLRHLHWSLQGFLRDAEAAAIAHLTQLTGLEVTSPCARHKQLLPIIGSLTGLRKLNLVWTDITDDTLRAIASNLPHLTALYLPTPSRAGWGRGITVQGIKACRTALPCLRDLYVKSINEFVSYPRDDDVLEHHYQLNLEPGERI